MKQYLTVHKKSVHLNIKKFHCNFCNKTFVTTSCLKNHQARKHSIERQFNCDSCSNSFVCQRDLRYHIQAVHEKIKTFKCDLCEKSFGYKKSLQNHQAVHSQPKFDKSKTGNPKLVRCRKPF